jgi:hypothetical protein
MLFGDFGCFGNGSGYVCALSGTDTNAIFAVTDHYKRAETETAAALYYTSNTVDVHDALVKLLFFRSNLRTTTTRAALTTATLAAAATRTTTITATLAILGLCLCSLFSCGCCNLYILISHG